MLLRTPPSTPVTMHILSKNIKLLSVCDNLDQGTNEYGIRIRTWYRGMNMEIIQDGTEGWIWEDTRTILTNLTRNSYQGTIWSIEVELWSYILVHIFKNRFPRWYCAVIKNPKREENQKSTIKILIQKRVKLSSDSDTGASSGRSYIKIHNRGEFAEWKRKTGTLASQQWFKRFLVGKNPVASEE